MSTLVATLRTRLRLTPVPGLRFSLYTAHPGSRLGSLATTSPYWAYMWSGGAVLARYIEDHPQTVAGLRILDFGCGGGVVGIAAAKAGAASVTATDPDAFARAATALNAAANEMAITIAEPGAPLPRPDLVLAGDVFYDPTAAAQSTVALDAFAADGIPILVGDPGRRDLPLDRLERLTGYDVPEVGLPPRATVPAAVYRWKA